MKKNILLLCIMCIMLSGCTYHERDDVICSVQEYDLTAEEERLLCQQFSDEDRIHEGKLYSHQIGYLEQIRFAQEYLEEKYSGIEFYIDSYTPITLESSIGTMVFRDYSSDEYYDLQIEEESEGYVVVDNYYGSLIEADYDRAVKELIESDLEIQCKVYTVFSELHGTSMGSSLTTEQIFELGSKLDRNTSIFVNAKDANTATIANRLQELMYDNNLYGSYTMFIGEDILERTESGKELKRYAIADDSIEQQSFNCFDLR